MGSSKKHKEKDKDREHKKKRKHRSRSRSKERKKHRHDRDRDYSDRERYRRDEEYPENDDSYPRELEDVDTRGSLKGIHLTKFYGFGLFCWDTTSAGMAPDPPSLLGSVNIGSSTYSHNSHAHLVVFLIDFLCSQYHTQIPMIQGVEEGEDPVGTSLSALKKQSKS